MSFTITNLGDASMIDRTGRARELGLNILRNILPLQHRLDKGNLPFPQSFARMLRQPRFLLLLSREYTLKTQDLTPQH